MSELFEPLKVAIIDQLILAIIRRELSDVERQILAFLFRHSGLGLTNQGTAKKEYDYTHHC